MLAAVQGGSRRCIDAPAQKNTAGFLRRRLLEKGCLRELLHTFFREASAFGGTLTGLEFRIALADNIERATAFDHLAISVAAFGGIE